MRLSLRRVDPYQVHDISRLRSLEGLYCGFKLVFIHSQSPGVRAMLNFLYDPREPLDDERRRYQRHPGSINRDRLDETAYVEPISQGIAFHDFELGFGGQLSGDSFIDSVNRAC